MAEINNAAVIGNFSVRPTGYSTDEQLDKLKRYDGANERAGHDRLHYQPAGMFCIDLYVLTTANSNAKASVAFDAPFPLTIWAADLGCESAAGGTGTVDLQVEAASILDAAQDVKTAAGTCSRVVPEVGKDDVAYGESIRIVQTAGGGAGDMIGGCAHIWAQRL